MTRTPLPAHRERRLCVLYKTLLHIAHIRRSDVAILFQATEVINCSFGALEILQLLSAESTSENPSEISAGINSGNVNNGASSMSSFPAKNSRCRRPDATDLAVNTTAYTTSELVSHLLTPRHLKLASKMTHEINSPDHV